MISMSPSASRFLVRLSAGWVLALLLAPACPNPVLAQAPSESVLQERNQAIQRAIQGQVRQSLDRITKVEPVAPRAASVARTAWIHEEPLASSQVMARLDPGASLTVTGQVPGGEWFRVEHEGQTGYVWRVSLTPPAPPQGSDDSSWLGNK